MLKGVSVGGGNGRGRVMRGMGSVFYSRECVGCVYNILQW